jgi:hypothetical protein
MNWIFGVRRVDRVGVVGVVGVVDAEQAADALLLWAGYDLQ